MNWWGVILTASIVLQLTSFVISETKMIVVWGEPNSIGRTQKNSSLTWDECIDTCFNGMECVMAWQQNQTCYIYNYYSITSVSQTDSSYGSIVAWKVNTPDNQCPTGTNPPTFGNQNATQTEVVETLLWILSIIKMDLGYEFYSDDGTSFSYDRGIELCQTKLAYLAGLVHPEDFSWFQKSTLNDLRPLLKTSDAYARIDGKRTVACQSTPATSECMSPNGFEYTGPPVPHFDNYNWVTNSSAMATPDDNCLVLVFKGNETPKVDVRGCSSNTSPLLSLLVYCSHTAWTYEADDYD